MENMMIALIQLTHQLCLKSSCKVLTEYEAMMYEKLCDLMKEYAIMFKRGRNEEPDQTKGGGA